LTFRLFSFYNQSHITHQTKRLQRSARPKESLSLNRSASAFPAVCWGAAEILPPGPRGAFNRLGSLQQESGNMKKKSISEETETEIISVKIPKDLKKRVNAYSDDNEMTIKHFIADAIIDKLELAHKERRRKSRL